MVHGFYLAAHSRTVTHTLYSQNQLGISTSSNYILQLMEAAEGSHEIAKEMKPIDTLVFLALSSGKNPFSKELLAKVAKKPT